MIPATAHSAVRRERHRYAFNDSKGYHDSDGPSACWIFIFSVMGAVLIFSGVWYGWMSFYDPRAEQVSAYNALVHDWNQGGGRAKFEATKFSYRVVSPLLKEAQVLATKCGEACAAECKAGDAACTDGCMSPSCKVEPAKTAMILQDVSPTSPEALAVAWTPFEASTQPMGTLDRANADNNRSDVETYTPLTYKMSGVFPSAVEGHWEGGAWMGHEYIVQVQAEEPGRPAFRFFLDDDEARDASAVKGVTLLKEVPVSANAKMCRLHHQNNMHDGRCHDRMSLNSVCMLLNETSAGGWALATGPGATVGGSGHFGCHVDPLTGRASNELAYSPFCPGPGYKHIGMGDEDSCDFSKLGFVVRSAMDPYVRAYKLTKGTMDLGSTPTSMWWSGVVMIAIGMLLMLPLAPMVYLKISSMRRRRYYSNRADHLDDLAQQPPSGAPGLRRRGQSPSQYDDSEADSMSEAERGGRSIDSWDARGFKSASGVGPAPGADFMPAPIGGENAGWVSCPSCGEAVGSGENFCPSCGTARPPAARV